MTQNCPKLKKIQY